MSKVLITSIGTGYDFFNKRFSYREFNYFSFENHDKTYTTRYFYDAYKNIFGCDKVIFLGTAGSDWCSLYEYLFEDNKKNYDKGYSDELLKLLLSENKNQADINTVRSKLTPIKEKMGDFCLDIILLKYGLNDSEHVENFELLKRISELLNDGDEVVFDITHSFRSLPLYELISMNYFKDVLKKDIKIKQVTYAMGEVGKEFGGKVPIVDMTKTLTLLDCIRAVDEYNRFGTAYALAEILDGDEVIRLNKEEKRVLKNLTEPVTSNNIADIKRLIYRSNRLTKGKDRRFSEYRILLDYIFKDISDRFSDKLEDEFELKLAIAKWHFENERFFAAAITVVESMLDYCSFIFKGKSNPSKEEKNCYREAFKKIRYNEKYDVREVKIFIECYLELKLERNDLCHNENDDDTIQKLQDLIGRLNGIYISSFKDNEKLIGEFKKKIESKIKEI